MRYFFSTGEASGELAATLLAQEIRRIDPDAQFEGIGASRMRAAGFSLWRDHTGWATFGPFGAIPAVPKLLLALLATAAHIERRKPDLVVLVDFGAFNVRLAKLLRRMRYKGAVLDIFPPSTWLDREKAARAVSAVATPLTAFAHQRDFYRSLDLPIEYFGHPLAAQYVPRAPRLAPQPDGGIVALLPGSRPAELRHHVPVLIAAFKELRLRRPQLRGIAGAATPQIASALVQALREAGCSEVEVAAGTQAAIAQADAAFVASGTAVLECVLSGVPAVAFYIVSPALARYFKRVYKRAYITIPNLVLDRPVVPELLQNEATPAKLAQTMHALLSDPAKQTSAFAELREALGPPDALQRCAQFAVELARAAC